jgi:hypothetical protein
LLQRLVEILDPNPDPDHGGGEDEPLLGRAGSRLTAWVPRTDSVHTQQPPHVTAVHNHCGDYNYTYGAFASSSRSTSFTKAPLVATSAVHHSSDEPSFFHWPVMEKVKKSKVGYWSSKLAVESEPGLTTAQLMLQFVFPSHHAEY